MAIVEIARIQVRRGQEKQTGIPTLAGGEFAWAADTEKLYIGISRADGGSRDGNVRILTENDHRNFFQIDTFNATYVFRSGTEITDFASQGEIERSLQQKLDDEVNAADFGILGNDINDNTQLLQNAVLKLFLSTSTSFQLSSGIRQKKILKIPTGRYRVSAPIWLPENAIIKGEGKDRTVITLMSTGTYTHVFQTIKDFDTLSIASPAGFNGPYINFDNMINLGETMRASNIHIEGMTLRYSTTCSIFGAGSLISLDQSPNSLIRDVKFEGYYTGVEPGDAGYSGIDMRVVSGADNLRYGDNIVIDNCEFKNLYYGVKSNYDVHNAVIVRSEFSGLNRGIVYNDPVYPIASLGPRFHRFTENRFYQINREGIFVGTGTGFTSYASAHISQNNQFIDVGNQRRTEAEFSDTGTAVISYYTSGNVSQNDYFHRFERHLRDGGNGKFYNPLINGRAAFDDNGSQVISILPSRTETVFALPITTFPQHAQIKYAITSPSGVSPIVDRQGFLDMYIMNSTDNTNPNVDFYDNYHYNQSDGIIAWTSNVNFTNRWVQLRFTNNQNTATYTMHYQLKILT